MSSIFKKAEKYSKQHPVYNAFIHALGGMGIGILITYPLVGNHPLRWGVILIIISLLGHFYHIIKK